MPFLRFSWKDLLVSDCDFTCSRCLSFFLELFSWLFLGEPIWRDVMFPIHTSTPMLFPLIVRHLVFSIYT